MDKKRFRIIILFLLIMSLLTGCRNRNNNEDTNNLVNLYFLSSKEKSLATESYYLLKKDQIDQVEEVLNQLVEGPQNAGDIRLLPRDLQVNKISIENEILKIDFSKEYYTNIQEEFLARISIIQTVAQINNITNVELSINEQPIKDMNDKIVGNMNVNNYIVSMGRPDQLKRKINITLYFANESGKQLLQETINADVPFNLPMEYTVVELLMDGPISEGQKPTINPKTKINSIKIKNSVCYIDLSEEFLESTSDIKEEVIVYSLVNTLVELPNFNKVMIYINGNVVEVYRDKVPMDRFLERNLDIVGE